MAHAHMTLEARMKWASLLHRQRERNAMAQRLAAEPGGVVLVQYRRHDGSPMGAVVTVSMERPGCWRVSYFDEDGFSGHQIFETKVAAVRSAVSEGYEDRDRDLLRRLCRTARFRRCIEGG